MVLSIRELKPGLWKDVEKLFGEKGACGGCWCMFWRHPLGEKWDEVKGKKNKQRFQKLVKSGKAHGALAYADREPVGWVSFDPRTDYLKLDRAPSLTCDDADRVWAIPCFYIAPKFRNKGVAAELLKAAVRMIKTKRGKIIEGYPVKPQKNGSKIPAAFAYTGTPPMFSSAGFKIVGGRDSGKLRVRVHVRRTLQSSAGSLE